MLISVLMVPSLTLAEPLKETGLFLLLRFPPHVPLLSQFSKCPTANWVAVVAAGGGASGEGAESQGRWPGRWVGSASLLSTCLPGFSCPRFFRPVSNFFRDPGRLLGQLKASPLETPPTTPPSTLHWSLQHQGEEPFTPAANKKGCLMQSATRLSFFDPRLMLQDRNVFLTITLFCFIVSDEDY